MPALDNETVAEAIREAAVALLHREIAKHGEVRLSPEDFEAAQVANDVRQAIKIDLDVATADIVLTHTKADESEPVN